MTDKSAMETRDSSAASEAGPQPERYIALSKVKEICERIMKASNDLVNDSAEYRIGQWSGAEKAMWEIDCAALAAGKDAAPQMEVKANRVSEPVGCPSGRKADTIRKGGGTGGSCSNLPDHVKVPAPGSTSSAVAAPEEAPSEAVKLAERYVDQPLRWTGDVAECVKNIYFNAAVKLAREVLRQSNPAVTAKEWRTLGYNEGLIEGRDSYVASREGWKLVPINPTEAMLDAIENGAGATGAYRDMLAAAPSNGTVSQDGQPK